MTATIRTLRRRLKTLGTRHPRWQDGFRLRLGPLPIQTGFRVTAIDASGAEFGFGVSAGWPEMSEQLARELAEILETLQGAPGRGTMTYATEQTCLTLREEVESLAHAIKVIGFSESAPAFDTTQEECERLALSTCQKVLDLLDERANA